MKIVLLSFLIALGLFACMHSQPPVVMGPTLAIPSPEPIATLNPQPPAVAIPVPSIQIGAILGATPDERYMIGQGVILVNKVMATDCFKQYVLKAKYTENQGLTQQQIWDKLVVGSVIVNADMYTGTWYANHISKTIGYEDTPGTVHMNRYFVTTAYMVADNLAHEGEGHSQGFSHMGTKSTSEPYGMNDAFEACAPQ